MTHILVKFLEDGIFFVCSKNKRNYKLVGGQVKVRWSDGYFYSAEVLGKGKKEDLLLICESLKENLPFVSLGK